MEFGRTAPQHPSFIRTDPLRKWVNIIILIYINFTNYTDRYLLAGILITIQKEFKMSNQKAGLIQTIFLVVYTSSAALFGYLGDRYSRKFLLVFAVIIWNIGNLACSFVKNYWVFCLCRALLGIGQACYTTVAPGVLSDLVLGDTRSKILAIFYTAIPVGTGLSYIVATQMAHAFGDWRWGLRATPFLAIPNIVLILFGLKEPKRGEVEGGTSMESTSWIEDMKYLTTNPSFMFSSLGFTAVAFTTGVTTWWAPKLNYLGFELKYGEVSEYREGSTFGLVTTLSGFIGLIIGYLSTFKLKGRYPIIDPVVCGVGLFLSAPLLIATTYASMNDKTICYVLLFFAYVFMNLNWAITMDICLCVVVPSRRASAVGVQLLLGHGLGDIGSPYLTGLISDKLFDHYQAYSDDPGNEFQSLQYAYFLGCAVEVLGGVFFFMNAIFIERDLEKKNDAMLKSMEQQQTASS